MNDSAITCDEIIKSWDEKIKTILTKFNEKKATCKMQSFYILPGNIIINIALSVVTSIYCYLIKYR